MIAAPPPPATVAVGGVTGIRLLVRAASGVTPPVAGQTTAAGKLGPSASTEPGVAKPSPVVGDVGELDSALVTSVANGNATSASPTAAAAVSQPVASGEVNNGLANIKEKTPMCLVNELARFNKISHQYKLVDETGPAHKKTFSVVLKLGEEEYAASGPSIKKAQHAAAESALRDTKYKHPISRNRSRAHLLFNTPTPTVELNALAMKRGDAVVYTTLEHPVPPVMPLGALHPLPPPHHLPHPVLGPGLSTTSGGANNSNHFPPSSHHHHHHHHHHSPHHQDFPHHPRFLIPPPSALNRSFGPPPPHPRAAANAAGVPPPFHPSSAYDFRGMYNQRYHHHHHPPPPNHHFPPPPPRPTKLFGVSLKVGSREFLGQGATRQLARHQAATKALACLRHLDAVEADSDPTSPSTRTTTTQQADESTTVTSSAIEESPTLEVGRRMSSQEGAIVVSGATGLSSPGPDHHYHAPGASTSTTSSSSSSPPTASYAAAVPPVVSFIDPVLRSMQDLTVDDDDGDGAGGDDKENYVDQSGNDLKSEISLVHEITLKRRLSVDFHVVKESGPPHMRVYVTRCDVTGPAQPAVWPSATQSPAAAAINGATTTTATQDSHQLLLKTEAEGNGKKVSKKKAADAMLKLLRALPPLPQEALFEEPLLRKGKMAPKKKRQNLIKVQKGNTDYGQGINPISRLIQIQQAKREKEPAFALLTERGLPRRREFVMQVTVNENQCTGTGPNKKLAKRAAAEVMLQMMGYSKPSPQPDKPAIRTPGTTPTAESANKKVTFTLSEAAAERGMIDGAGQLYRKSRRGGSATLQQLPGVIFMPEGAAGVAGIFNSSPETEAISDRGSTTEMRAKSKVDGGPKTLRLHIPNKDPSPHSNATNSQELPPQVGNAEIQSGVGHHTIGVHFQPVTAPSSAHPSAVKIQHPAVQIPPAPVATIASCRSAPGSITILPRASPNSVPPIPGTVRPKQQLIYLAEVLGFHVNFTDFPKKGHGQEYLSLVSLTTNPPQVSHGSGVTLEASQDAASLHALKCLAELGLETVSGSGGADNNRSFAAISNAQAPGNVPSAGTGPPSSFANGNPVSAANVIINSMQQEQQQPQQPQPQPQHQLFQNRQAADVHTQHVLHNHQHIQEVPLGIQALTPQRVQHHLQAS